MQTTSFPKAKADLKFPPFDLRRLLKTTLNPQKDEKICILIDLPNPKNVVNFEFLNNDKFAVQKKLILFFIKV